MYGHMYVAAFIYFQKNEQANLLAIDHRNADIMSEKLGVKKHWQKPKKRPFSIEEVSP